MWEFLITGLLAAYAAAFFIRARTPVRYAVDRDDLPDLDDGIVVKRGGAAGWMMLGDQDAAVTGFEEPVRLSGGVPPENKSIVRETAYYCVAEYVGQWAPPEGGEYDEFHVYEWFPIAPVRRITVFPESWFPDGFLSLRDQNPIWPAGRKLWNEERGREK